MARSYKVQLTAGTHTWTVTDLDAPGYGLADPLSIGWSQPDTDQRPTQPDTMVATFSVVVATADDLDDLVLGDKVTIAVTFGPVDKAAPDVSFYGRIAQGQAAAHPRGVLYTFTCADASTDLNGYDVGASAYAVETVATRLGWFLTRSGLPAADLVVDPVVSGVDVNLTLDLVDQPSATNLLAALVDLYAQVALSGLNELAGTVAHRAIVAPYPGPSSKGLPFRWALDAVPDAYIPTAQTPLPAVFGPWFTPPQSYGLRIDRNDRAAAVIDACYLEFDSEWSALIPATVNRAAVTWFTAADALPDTDRVQQVTYVVETLPPVGQTPSTATRETQAIGYTTPTTTAAQANATRLGGMMVPPPQNLGAWAPDTFRWLLYADPAGLASFPVIFPRHDATNQPTPAALRTAAYVRPVTIVGIPGKWNPADAARDWVAGQLATVQLTIEGGRPVVDFQLFPTIPEPGNPDTGTRSWNSRAGTWNAQTGVWNDLAPGRVAFRWSDASLVGVVWNQLRPQSWNMYRLARGS